MATSRIAFVVALAASIFIVGVRGSPDVLDAQCRNLTIELGAALSNFDQCALDHSRPFTMCLQCAPVYEHARDLFAEMVHFKTPRSKQCRNLIVDGKVSLINVNYEHIKYVWTRQGICDECFVPGSYNLTEQVAEFFVLRNKLNGCINETVDSNSTCTTCHPEYRTLTKYFDKMLHLDIARFHHMCLDMADAMNRTREAWGDQCFHSKRLSYAVLLGMGAIPSSATLMFYFLVRAVLGPIKTELAETHTMRTDLQSRSGEFGAAFRAGRLNLQGDLDDDSLESDIAR